MIKKLLIKLIDAYTWWRVMLNFKKAKKRANKLNQLTGKRWHVLPIEGTMRYIVVDNGYINRYNRYVAKKQDRINIEKLLKMSYYSTPVNLRRSIYRLTVVIWHVWFALT
jgi:hypothetical protein